MSGARWGMTLDEVLSAVGTNVVRHTASSVYYFIQLDGSPALSQYVFSTDGQLVRQILYLANPKREAYLPKQTLDEVEKNFERFRRLLEARYGAAAVVTQAVAVSGRLESQSRTVRDQIAATKEEIRGLEAQMETRRRELQREFIGERDRNARVVAGLSDLERTLQQAQRRLRSFEGEFGQIQTAIRAETAELPEGTRPFHWESNWENGTAVVALYLTVNPRGNYLALSLTDPGSTP